MPSLLFTGASTALHRQDTVSSGRRYVHSCFHLLLRDLVNNPIVPFSFSSLRQTTLSLTLTSVLTFLRHLTTCTPESNGKPMDPDPLHRHALQWDMISSCTFRIWMRALMRACGLLGWHLIDLGDFSWARIVRVKYVTDIMRVIILC